VSTPSIDIASPVTARRSAARVNGLWILLGLLVIMALLPVVASPYAIILMLPFMGYGIALLGFNLLFGTTGLLSFGHALFLGIGAYTAATLTFKFGVLSFELLLITAALISGMISLAVGALCVRYTRIFFGMLTLAFGMLFHSFLYKFYNITGGDQGMRVLRPLLHVECERDATVIGRSRRDIGQLLLERCARIERGGQLRHQHVHEVTCKQFE